MLNGDKKKEVVIGKYGGDVDRLVGSIWIGRILEWVLFSYSNFCLQFINIFDFVEFISLVDNGVWTWFCRVINLWEPGIIEDFESVKACILEMQKVRHDSLVEMGVMCLLDMCIGFLDVLMGRDETEMLLMY